MWPQICHKIHGMRGIAFAGETLSTSFFRGGKNLRKCNRKPPCRWSASLEQISAPSVPKRLKKGDILDLQIEKISLSGSGIGYVRNAPDVAPEDVGLPVFTPKGGTPGDVVRCTITKVRRGDGKARAYADSYFVQRLTVSPTAVPARCAHFGNFRLGGGGCGGCSTMTMEYEGQLLEKQAQIEALFNNYDGLEHDVMRPILGSERIWNYRNKMEFSYGRKWYVERPEKGGVVEYSLGLHAPQRFDKVVEIDRCHIQEDIGNDILSFVRIRGEEMLLEPCDPLTKNGYMRNVAIRTARNANNELEVMVNIITSPCDIPGRLYPLACEIMTKFPNVVCVVQNMPKNNVSSVVDPLNERLIAGGRHYIEQKLCNLVFQISANSFFQTNAYQAEILYQQVAKAAALRESDVVVDLFCGTGTIGLSLAKYCKKVYGLELVDAAVHDARRNAERNGITNAEFEKVNLEKLKHLFLSECHSQLPDVIIVDPPRAGLHKSLVKQLVTSSARRIVYVSCNPASQMRDLQYMQQLAPDKYRISRIQPICMFPHTHHIENVVTLDMRI